MKIVFHGAAKEVGKSCIEIQTKTGKRYLMDAGVKFVHKGIEYPRELDKVYQLDGIFLSHAHLDHSGALPMLEHKQLQCPIYTTHLTWKITNELLKDSYHLEKLKFLHPAYVERDIKKVQNDIKQIKYDKWYETKDKEVKFMYLNSGHIPGGASILLEVENKRILYTADYNTQNTYLMVPSVLEKVKFDKPVDILITENTYGNRMHPDKKDSEEGLLKSIESCINEGGSALVPVFGVGRAQEIMMILSKLPKDIPIYLDGMARKINEIVLNSDDPYVDNRDILEEMFKRVIRIKSPREREQLLTHKKIVILTTSGMLQGGPSVSYAEKMVHHKQDYILLTGYQALGTNGRSIFEDHLFYQRGTRHKVKSHVRKFDFSAHLGQDNIHNTIKNIGAKYTILQHGDVSALDAVKYHFEQNEKIETKIIVPEIGQIMEF